MHENRHDESRHDAPEGPRGDPPDGPSASAAGARSGSGGHRLSAEEAARLAEELRDARDPDLDTGVVPLAPAPSSEARALVAAPPERPPVALPERKIELGAAARPAAGGEPSQVPAAVAGRNAALAAARLPTAGPTDATAVDLVAASRRPGPRRRRAGSLRTIGVAAGMLAAALLAAYALSMRSGTRASSSGGEVTFTEPSPAVGAAPGLADTGTSAVGPAETSAAPSEAKGTAEASAESPAPAGKLAPPPKPRPTSKVGPQEKPAPSVEPPPTGTSPLPPPDSIRVF